MTLPRELSATADPARCSRRYQGKNVVITGGSSGIGLATAQLLVDHGARVMITGRSQDALDRAVQHLGSGATAIRSDAASLDDIDGLTQHVMAEFAAIDLLFLNAGITRFVAFEAMTEEIYDELQASNTKGQYFATQRLAPLLRRGASIVLTTSVANTKGLPMISAYAASKAALRSITRSLAQELIPHGVRVNAVSPGPIDTGILERGLPANSATATRQQMTENNPMKWFGEPVEVARAVAFLGFEATYTNGAELTVDGGASQL